MRTAMQIIPSIDLYQGRVVRLRKGSYDEVTTYADDPAALAAAWSDSVSRMHVVDLSGARDGQMAHSSQIEAIVRAFGPGVQIGGGVRSLETVEHYLALGAERVVMGTAAVRDRDLLRGIAQRHPDRVVVALDARGGFVATEGWREVSAHRAGDLARDMSDIPLAALLYTDIERDGTEVGPNVTATRELAVESGFPVIASGGVGTLAHLEQLAEASRATGNRIAGAVLGRALHERRFTLDEAVAAAST